MGLVVWKINACWVLELETIRAVPASEARAFNSCLTRLWTLGCQLSTAAAHVGLTTFPSAA